MIKIYLILISLFFISYSNAQWQQSGGPEGGYINCISIAGENIFIGTNAGVFVSKDNGSSWYAINKGIENIKVISLAIDESSIFIGTDRSGLYRSTNNGSDWSKVDLKYNSTSQIFYVYSIAIDKNKIFAGTDAGIFLSTDNGENWTSMNNGFANETSIIHSVAICDTNIFAGTFDGEIYLSTNNGANWNLVLTDLPNPNHTSIHINTILLNDTNIYAGTDEGIYLSTNNGKSWSSLNTTNLTDTKILSLAVSGMNIFAATPTGIFYSADNGLNWTTANNGLPKFPIKSIVIKDTNNIYAGTYGFFHSANGGNNWIPKNNGLLAMHVNSLVTTDTSVVAATEGGIYFSNNTIERWYSSANNGERGLYNVSALAKNDKNLFATGTYYNNNMNISSDNGVSWIKRNYGLQNVSVKSISCSDSIIVAGTGYGVYLSSNNGDIWEKTSIGDYIYTTAVSGTNYIVGGYCFCGASSGSRLYLSTDNGKSWVNKTKYLGYMEVSALAMNDSNIIIGNSKGIFFSSDYGNTWILKSNSLINLTINSIFIDGLNIIVGTSNGILKSNNNGNSWEDISFGLSNRKVLSIAINNTYAFVGTAGSSVWKRPLNELITNIEPSPEYLINIYPNPVSAKLTIETKDLTKGSILSILNINGQELINQQLNDSKTQIDVSKLTSGIYFVKIINDGIIEIRKVIKE